MRFLIPVLVLALSACASDTDMATPADDSAVLDGGVAVGEPVGADLIFVSADDLATRAAELDGQTVAVEGTVREVCQQKGCWLTLDNAAGVPIRVSVPKDGDGEYLYTFPMDTAGRPARLAGTVAVEETDVETLRHFAEDEGKDAAAVAAITQPERTIVLTATGAAFEAGLPAEHALPPGHPPLPEGHPPIGPGESMEVGPLKPEAERTIDA